MTKYVCIKDYYDNWKDYYDNWKDDAIFKKGKIYHTVFRNKHVQKGSGTYMELENNLFNRRFDDKELKEHFVNLAVWREQQINSILND